MHPTTSNLAHLSAIFHALALITIILSGLLLMVPMRASRKLATRFFLVGIIMAAGAAIAPGFLA